MSLKRVGLPTHPHTALLLTFAVCSLPFAVAAQQRSVPEQAIANLKKLRSFRYSLALSRTEPPLISGSFTGTVVLPDTQEQEGSWADQPRFRVKARGEIEYLQYLADRGGDTTRSGVPFPCLADTVWSVQARGEEARFLPLIERAIARDSFKLVRQDAQVEEFSFAPNTPFLDPTLTKRLTGRFKVQRGKVLPLEIGVTSSDQVVSWLVKFTDFNRTPPVAFPFVKQWRIVLAPDRQPGIPSPQSLLLADTAALHWRFRAHGFETRFIRAGDTLQLYLEQEIRNDLLRALIQPGIAEVWIGRPFSGRGPVPESARKLPIPGDTTREMLLERRVLTRADIAAFGLIESAGTRLIRLTLTRAATASLGKSSALENSGLFWVLTVDDAIVARERIAKRSRAELLELEGPAAETAVRDLLAVLDGPVLPQRLRVVARERIAK
jgi:hypothetical protein